MMSLSWRFNPARFLRGEGPEPSPLTLNRRRVYILPNRHGLVFTLVILAMLIGAINYNNSLAFALTFLLASIAVIGILHTFRNLNRLRFHAGRVQPVFAGQMACFSIGVQNTSDTERLALRLALPGETGEVVDALDRHIVWVSLCKKAPRRGRLEMGRFSPSTVYPLGLFRAWAHVDLGLHAVIYPQPADTRGLPQSLVDKEGALGDKGLGHDDFAALRPYHAGDSLRHVHWKAAAREQGLQTKLFGGHQVEEIWLDWSQLSGMGVEARLSQLCRWVLDADTAGLAYGLRLPGQTFDPDLGEHHRHRCLEALALYGTDDGA